jgi:hypothetical protein
MSAKKEFMRRLNESSEIALQKEKDTKKDLAAFKEANNRIHKRIENWLNETSIKKEYDEVILMDNTDIRNPMPSMYLKNLDSIANFKPQYLYRKEYNDKKGFIHVSICNPQKIPQVKNFNICFSNEWSDDYLIFENTLEKETDFNEESFFKMMDHFI